MDEPTKSAREPEGLPRWVVMLLIGLVVAVLLVVAMMLIGGGGHQIPDHGTMGSGDERDFVAAVGA
jgi:hypothetical protein